MIENDGTRPDRQSPLKLVRPDAPRPETLASPAQVNRLATMIDKSGWSVEKQNQWLHVRGYRQFADATSTEVEELLTKLIRAVEGFRSDENWPPGGFN